MLFSYRSALGLLVLSAYSRLFLLSSDLLWNGLVLFLRYVAHRVEAAHGFKFKIEQVFIKKFQLLFAPSLPLIIVLLHASFSQILS